MYRNLFPRASSTWSVVPALFLDCPPICFFVFLSISTYCYCIESQWNLAISHPNLRVACLPWHWTSILCMDRLVLGIKPPEELLSVTLPRCLRTLGRLFQRGLVLVTATPTWATILTYYPDTTSRQWQWRDYPHWCLRSFCNHPNCDDPWRRWVCFRQSVFPRPYRGDGRRFLCKSNWIPATCMFLSNG